MNIDVIIIGSGISGLVCAAQCVKEGLKVIILEKKSKEESIQNRPVKVDKSVFTEYLNRGPYPREICQDIKAFHVISPEGGKRISYENKNIYGINLQSLRESLIEEIESGGGKIYYKAKPKKIKINYNNNIWQIKWRRFLRRKTFYCPVMIDAAGIHSTYRKKYSIEKGLLAIGPEWICQSLHGEYRVTNEWGPLSSNESYSIVGRHSLLSIQHFFYDKTEDKLVYVLGALKKTPNPIQVGLPILKSELFSFINVISKDVLYEKIGQIPLKHSALALVNDGYMMIGDSAFLTNSQYVSGVASAIISAKLAAKTIIYIYRNNMEFNYHNLYSYSHEYMMTRGKQMLETHAQMRFAMNFSRKEMEKFFKNGFIKAIDLEKILKGQKQNYGLKTIFRKFYPIVRDMRLSYKIAKNFSYYQDFKKHLEQFPYFPSKDELIVYSRTTIKLLNKIYNPHEANRKVMK
jgi:flavin-dependent dehydrogenase